MLTVVLTVMVTVIRNVFCADPEDKSSKIKVEIKPITSPSDQTPNNVDDIRNLVKGLRLSPTANVSRLYGIFHR